VLAFPASGAYFSADWIRKHDEAYGIPEAVRQLRDDDAKLRESEDEYDGAEALLVGTTSPYRLPRALRAATQKRSCIR
jgi:hypothetical protein